MKTEGLLRVAPTASTAWPALAGRLEVFSPFEILQVLSQLQRSGRLEIGGGNGRPGACQISHGRIQDVHWNQLEGREAAIAILSVNDGEFRFFAEEFPPRAGDLSIEEIMLETARLTDELSLRARYLPPLNAPLVPGAAMPIEAVLDARVAVVWNALQGQPPLTLEGLELAVAQSPLRIHLSIALLVASGAFAGGGEPAVAIAPKAEEAALSANPLWGKLLKRYPRGVRLLITHAADAPVAELIAAARTLGRAIGQEEVPSNLSALGPSFLRFRPPGGGLLSLTFLPMIRQNRHLFDALAVEESAILVCGWSSAGPEAELWLTTVPPEIDLEVLDETRSIGEELRAALIRLGRNPS
jgi:hypothetical protein